MPIPKKIHYCWFGKNPKTEKEIKCIESWKKNCPDYEIIEWNEDNYDINGHAFMVEAYQKGKWAFVSDYARLDIIYQNGGIYLDTDVEVIKSLDNLLTLEMFAGFQDENEVAFGLGFGAEKGHPYLKEIMQLYNEIHIPDNDIELSKISCPILQTKILKKHGLIQNGESQILDRCNIYAIEFFSPKSFKTGEITVTEQTYSIHHFNMSWFSTEAVELRDKKWELERKYSSAFMKNIVLYSIRIKQFPLKIIKKYKQNGVKGIIKYLQLLFRNILIKSSK